MNINLKLIKSFEKMFYKINEIIYIKKTKINYIFDRKMS